MSDNSCTRRALLTATVVGGAGLAGASFASPEKSDDEAIELIRQLKGKTATRSDRLHLDMPAQFPTGSTVPLTLTIESPMLPDDHIRSVDVVAPANPLIEVVTFHFVPQRSAPRVSTRIRLAGPQHVIAIAEMSDGALLMTKTWVEAATNGCT